MKTTHRIALIAAGFAGLALLPACSGSSDEAPVETNVANIAEPENVVVVENVATPTPTPETNTAAATPTTPSGPDFSDTEQTQQDADATGMTARVSRGDASGNETAPTE
jgi:hypothetical protein